MTKIAGVLCMVILPGAAHAQSESFVVRMGPDTIARETFVRSASRVQGDLSGAAVGGRMRYDVELTNGVASRLNMEIFAARVDTPHIRITADFVGDSAIAQVARAGAAAETQRLGTRRGAIPFINLAFSLVEVATMSSARAPGDTATVWFFITGNGATVPAKLTRNAADSAILSMGGMDLRLHLDSRGRILHGALAAQKLTIERVAGTLNRSAEAAPDYSAPPDANYTAEDVSVRTSAGHVMAGTLTLPKQRRGKIPAVITISGSGAQDRDEALGFMRGYRPFREIAEALASRGVAALRYDDRGYGSSTGVHGEANTLDFADDTRALLAYLRTRPEIDSDKIFLVGHSEGGMIAPMVAAEDRKLRGIVLLAGPAQTGRAILEYQTRLSADQATDKTPAQRDSLFQAGMKSLESAGQPWVNYFLTYDPLPFIRKVRSPVLIIHGATDRQVTAEQAGVLANTLRAAGNTDVAVHVLPDVNHLFLSDPLGYGSGYTSLATRTVVPQLLKLVADWIVTKSR